MIKKFSPGRFPETRLLFCVKVIIINCAFGKLEEKVATTEKKVEKLQEQINELWDYQVNRERLEFTERKIVDLEDRSRRNKLRINGISEKENET